jgi:hypothetical protein
MKRRVIEKSQQKQQKEIPSQAKDSNHFKVFFMFSVLLATVPFLVFYYFKTFNSSTTAGIYSIISCNLILFLFIFVAFKD